MPFDVYTKDGKKLGHITALSGGLLNHYLVELDSSESLTSKVDRDKYIDAAYKHFGLKSMTGKIKEKKLDAFVEYFKQNEKYAALTQMRPEEMVLFSYLCNSYTNSILNGTHLSRFSPADKRFVVIQPLFCEYNGQGLVISNELPDIPVINRKYFIDDREFAVIPCKVADLVGYSYGELGYIGSGSIAQSGGYNHVHYTNLPLVSGNTKLNLPVKMQVMCREGDPLYLLMDDSFMVRHIYVEGAFYTCNVD